MDVEIGAAPRGPLAGIRVLDMSTVVSGPLCAQVLGDLGAEIVKVESPGGDSSRVMGLPMKDGISPLFGHCNRNKRSVHIDLKSEAGQVVARRLATSADLLIENFRPGVAERLGLGYEVLAKRNPKLVYLAISGFGPDGPRRDEPAYDTVIQGLTGFMPIQGADDAGLVTTPRLVQNIAADKVTALTAAYSAMAALFARERGDGRGQRVDVPMLDAYAAFLMPDLLAGKTFPDEPEPPRINVHRTWATADGHVVMMIIEDRQFFGLCRAIDREDMLDDPRCANLLQRIIHVEEIFPLLEEEVRKWPTAELLERARKFEAPVAPVNDLEAFLADSQVAHNRTIFELEDDPALGRTRYVRQPARFERTPATLRRRPPRAGEQTRDVLRESGFSDEEIEALVDAGAVQVA